MTKTQIVKWVEAKKNEAIEKVMVQAEEAVNDYKRSVLQEAGLHEMAQKVGSLIAEAADLSCKFEEALKSNPEIEIYDYRCFSERFCKYVGGADAIENLMMAGILRSHRCKKIVDITDRADKMRSAVITNYNNAIENVRSCKNPKEAVAYLKSLGFDTSRLGEPEKSPGTMLSAPVDQKFLLIIPNGGEANDPT